MQNINKQNEGLICLLLTTFLLSIDYLELKRADYFKFCIYWGLFPLKHLLH